MDVRVGYPQPGDRVGPYVVERQLGRGGMGVVYVARDPGLDRRVALKVISPDLAQDPTFRERFTREAQAQASLDSPHVVHVYAHGESGGRLYIATQLVPGADLGAMLLSSGAPPARVAVDLVAQVAAGLADAHASGLVHRDIKPANVLVAPRDQGYRAYLADFGIACRLDGQQGLTVAGTLGTPAYMAPELHTGGEPGVASDVYSVGCLLWSALSGRPPYDGGSDYQVVSAHLHRPVPQLPATGVLAAGVNRVLRTAMAKQPGARYASAAQLRDDLVGVLREAEGLPPLPPPVAPPPSLAPRLAPAGVPEDVPLSALLSSDPPPARPPRERGRGRLVLLVVAVVAVLAGGLGAGWALTRGADGPGPGTSPATPPATSSEPSPEPSSEPTPVPEPTDGGTASALPTGLTDVERAATGLTEGFTPLLGASTARCVATELLRAVQLEVLVQAGFFDQAYVFQDPDLTGRDDIKLALNTATLVCAGELAS